MQINHFYVVLLFIFQDRSSKILIMFTFYPFPEKMEPDWY